MIGQRIVHMRGEHGEAALAIQWGDEKVILAASDSALVLDLEAIDNLLDALLEAKASFAKAERVPLYARVPPSLKARFVARATEMDLTQNAAIIAAVRTWLDRLVEWRPK